MSKTTDLLCRAAAVAAVSGVVFALQSTPASASAPADDGPSCETASGDASDLSPSTQKAWADFICGGSYLTGGAAKMVSGAWIGAPGTIIAGATGEEMTPEQKQAWENWDSGATEGGMGAAMIVSGVYTGAPGYILDKIQGGATPADLTPQEMSKVSFMMPADELPLPTEDLLSLDLLGQLEGLLPSGTPVG